MSELAVFLCCSLASYLLGAVPFGYIVARAKGVNIRAVGSGNIGATNVYRSVSKPLGILTFVLDALKGLAPVLLCPLIAAGSIGNESRLGLKLLCAMAAVAGHNWPVYLRFKGGKGVATSAGALAGIAPESVMAGLAVWCAVFVIMRYVSLASMLAGATVAVTGWFLYAADSGHMRPLLLTALALVGIWRHKSNILRLRHGTEHRAEFGKGKLKGPPT